MGMISTELVTVQELHLQVNRSLKSPTKWAIGFIMQLLQIAHTQLIYRCLIVQDRTSGTLINVHKAELCEEITNQLSLGAENLMESDKYLLECNLSTLAATNSKQQAY
jgi:hypothetical protein